MAVPPVLSSTFRLSRRGPHGFRRAAPGCTLRGRATALLPRRARHQNWLASAASSAALGGHAGQRRDLAILARTGEPPLGLLAAIPVRDASLFPQMWYLSLGYGSLRGCVGHFFGQIAHVFGKIGCTRLCTLNFRFYRKTRGSDGPTSRV
jgi:hypothetical protein